MYLVTVFLVWIYFVLSFSIPHSYFIDLSNPDGSSMDLFPLFKAGGLFTMRPPCDTDTVHVTLMENTLLDE